MVTDKGYTTIECRIAENMVGMLMGVDNIPHRLVGYRSDLGQQRLANRHGAAGVDNRDSILSNDDPNVGDVARILWVRQRNLTEMGVIAVGYAFNGKCIRRECVSGRRSLHSDGKTKTKGKST